MKHDATRPDRGQGDEPTAADDDSGEYVVFPSDKPRMTAEELLADAASKAAGADAAVRAHSHVVAGCTRAMRALLDYLDEPLFIEVECPCCGALYDPVAYVQHVANPPSQCDRERWALVVPADEVSR